ncbi:LAME_0H13212g1_1 [Lachancea meyersii CBS 8951]|uniref:LAME_0H13212g1_1 n=1 Tax=Lachancea meyersii CBS 8951 TaxID=1266667 RepID=A0A1G4KGY3_9SACH|nr:LAME_0H13212g1_1 [Lachancea meyersii CBS 8951]
MENAQSGSFSTPLKKPQPEVRQFGSLSHANYSQPLKHHSIVNDNDEGRHDNSRDKENDLLEAGSSWKRARVAKQDESRENLNSSPAVIEMLDRDANGLVESKVPDEALEDAQEDISEAITSAVREISHSDMSNHENGNQTSLFRNLLSPARRVSPEKHPLTPIDAHHTGLSNLDSLTPLKSYVQGSEEGILQALQSRFRQELTRYEHHLRAKNQQTDEYRKETISSLEKIKKLDESLDEQKLAFSVLWGEHEVLKASQAAKEAKWEGQTEDLERVSDEKSRLEERVSKLKLKLSEVRNEIKMLHQNSQILQEKFQLQIQDNDSLKKQLEVCEERESKLQYRLEKLQSERDELRVQKDHQDIEMMTLKTAMTEHELESRTLQQRIAHLENLLRERENACRELQSTVESFEDTKRQSTTELENRVTDLLSDIKGLKAELEAVNKLKVDLDESRERLRASEGELASASESMRTLRESEIALEKRSLELEEQLTQHKQRLESVTDQMAIKSAELEELQHDLEELRQTKSHLEEFVKIRDAAVEDWKAKYDSKCAENNKLAVEIESYQFRNGNLESEHLVELEQLHQQMTSLQDTLRARSEQIAQLENEKSELQSQLSEDAAKHAQANDGALSESPALSELKAQVESLRQQLQEKDADTSKRLQLLAEDLYIQYSSKHEQKVKMLKKGYETNYQDKIERMALENTGLRDELHQLNNMLKTERDDKQRLVQLLNK